MKTEFFPWKDLPPETKKAFIFIAITIFIIGSIVGGFIYYQWPHKEMESYLDQKISYLEKAQDELNQIKDKYPGWRQLLENAEQSYLALKKENNELHEKIISLNQKLRNSSNSSSEKDELMPGYNLCLDRANNDFDMKDCANTAFEYWDKKLNKAYKKIISICNDQENPGECKKSLKDMETSWIVFHDTMTGYIYNGGISGDGGTLDKVLGIDFLAQETKRQCLRLEALIAREGH